VNVTIKLMLKLAVLVCMVLGLCHVSDVRAAETGVALEIHVIGADHIRLIDPRGRVFPRADSTEVLIPGCQSWENITMRPRAVQVPQVPRSQVAVTAPLEGTYRIELIGTGQPGFLEFLAWSGDSTMGAQESFTARPGTKCRWEASWRRPRQGKQFEVTLRRLQGK